MRRAFALAALTMMNFGVGCGGGSSHLHYTPPGTYQFLVTGSSTSGVQIVKTVTLEIVITPR